MADEIIGRIMMNFTGDYDTAKNYTRLDTVMYEGSTYVCKVDATGVEPTDTTHWQLIARKGDRGYNIWFDTHDYSGNAKGAYWSDLYGTAPGNGPQVGDLIIQPDGSYYQVTAVSNTDDGQNGGGTFDTGTKLGSLQGPKEDKGDTGPAGVDYMAWKIINDVTDLNTLRTDGRYWLKGNMTNAPHDGWGYLFVDSADPIRILQRWVGDMGSDLYLRTWNDNSWTPWKKVTYGADINVISQANYDALADKSGLYIIQG